MYEIDGNLKSEITNKIKEMAQFVLIKFLLYSGILFFCFIAIKLKTKYRKEFKIFVNWGLAASLVCLLFVAVGEKHYPLIGIFCFLILFLLAINTSKTHKESFLNKINNNYVTGNQTTEEENNFEENDGGDESITIGKIPESTNSATSRYFKIPE